MTDMGEMLQNPYLPNYLAVRKGKYDISRYILLFGIEF